MAQWTQEIPQQPGTYLWVTMWECPCRCWRRVGVVEILDGNDIDGGDGEGCMQYTSKDGRLLNANFYGERPEFWDGVWHVNSITRLDPPPQEHFSNEFWEAGVNTMPSTEGTRWPVQVNRPDMGERQMRCDKCHNFVSMVVGPHDCTPKPPAGNSDGPQLIGR